ncbi:peptidoglycan lytic protein P45 [Listeria weihenstephanensis FSL R9-0317]|uniref:Peptidase P60 n=1 Tax=Listeria weihenstephanensis TaxID=1006155 RepID=A0A1S7FRM3_9LIST|nr:NlpC/P60 family protein [Listeria weihenstephanensis]AQY50050.1 peptidase P60 [Listeria weihenstephanensis]EUJ40411.1 peptidoglycan lytic protein P45 [Listeria weihenstephanensis FSL R9-0317]MBC1500414.1 peptidase P60 [Listeria weihenstephanensis]
MKKNTLIAASMAAVISLSPVFTTNAFADVNTDIQQKDAKLNDLKSKKADLQADLSSLVSKLDSAQAKSKELQASFNKSAEQLKKLNADIAAINARIKEREVVLKERARSMQVNSNSNVYLDVVLSADNFGDLVDRVSAVNTIVESDKAILDEQQKDEDALKASSASVKKEQEKQQKAIASYEQQQNQIEAQKAEKEAVVAQLAAQQATTEQEKSTLIAQRDREAAAAAARAAAAKEATTVQPVAASTSSDETKSSESSSNTASASTSNDSSSKSSTSTAKKKETSNSNNTGSSNIATPTGSGYDAMISTAYAQLGKPYSLGATGPGSFDCSGFTSYAFRAAGVSIPRTSGAQYAASTKISSSQAKPGDLVFFSYGSGIAHVGIYIGGGKMINAQNNGVSIDSLSSSFWAQSLVGFGRIANF